MGQKSPAKVLRNAKRITKFLRNKWKMESCIHAQISIRPCQSLAIQTKTPIIQAKTNSIQPKPITYENLMMIFKQNEANYEIEREKMKLERKKQREMDLDKFQVELKSKLEDTMKKFALPP